LTAGLKNISGRKRGNLYHGIRYSRFILDFDKIRHGISQF
jgi:hypothetical protein